MSIDVKRPTLKEFSVVIERNLLEMKPIVPKGQKANEDDEEICYKLKDNYEDEIRYKINNKFKITEQKSSSVLKSSPIQNPVKLTNVETNTNEYPNSLTKSPAKPSARVKPTQSSMKNSKKSKVAKAKNKIKVNFWSSKSLRPHKKDKIEPIKRAIVSPSTKRIITPSTKRIITPSIKRIITPSTKGIITPSTKTLVTPTSYKKPQTKVSPKVRHKVSSFPPPELSDQHSPMVTVPDDLTVQLNEEEVNDLLSTDLVRTVEKRPRKTSHSPQVSPRNGPKRKLEDAQNSDLEYFAKYIVHKLRKMETNQRIYSENLINTVLMLGQLQQLNGKSRVIDAPPV